MKENKSPELRFWPDNDTDDYTMAVVMINEEFATIREEEQEKTEIAKENAKEIAKEIKMVMKEKPFVNAEELAEKLNVSVTKVRYHIRAMKKNGEIQRIGSTKSGKWEVLE